MKKVYSAENIIDAQLICDQLLDLGIEAIVKGGYLTGAIGELPPDQLTSVWVVDSDLEAYAKQQIRRIEAQRQEPSEDRVCEYCNETSDSRFKVCWSCQKPLL